MQQNRLAISEDFWEVRCHRSATSAVCGGIRSIISEPTERKLKHLDRTELK
jgi:hypothetical protein